MNPDHDDRDEAALRELFEATAQQPTGSALTRMAARASDVPRRASAWGWLLRWAWVPAVASMGAAAAAWVLYFRPSTPMPSVPVPVALSAEPSATPGRSRTTALPVRTQPSASATAAPDAPQDPLDELSGAGLLAGLDPDLTDDDLATDPLQSEYDALFSPPSDADLDAWLLATNELLDDGS